MNAVGRLGSYISRSVYTVSGPFHPFGGAVDIIVVEQPDGSFKSSPWYVRFGKFQGVLKAKEKIVSIVVNGVEADFHMYLDHKGEAHFIREVEGEDADSSFSSPSSGDDTDGQLHTRWPVKSKSCNYDSHQPDIVTQIDASNGNVIARTNSRRSRILGFVLGRRSAKENRFLEGDNDSDFVRKELLESAEIAADLLEVKWSRSLVSSRRRNNGVLPLSSQDTPDENSTMDLITDGQDSRDSLKVEGLADDLDGSSPLQQFGSSNNEKDHSSNSGTTELQESVKESAIAISCLVSENVAGASPVENNSSSVSQKLSESEKFSLDDGGRCLKLVDVKLETRSGEQYVLGNLQTTELTFEEKCQAAVGSNFTRSSCFEEIVERDLCIFPQNGKSLECEGVLIDDMESQSTSTISTFNSQICEPLLDKTMSNDGIVGELESPLDNKDAPVGSYTRRSESPEAEPLFFGDLDDINVQMVGSMSPHHVGECELLSSQVRTEEENQSPIPDHVSVSSTDLSGQEFLAENAGGMGRKLKAALSDNNIHETIESQLEDVSRTARSLPNMSMHDCGVGHSLGHAPDSGYASQMQAQLQKDVLSGILEAVHDQKPSTSPQLTETVRSIENLKKGSECPTLGTASRPSDASPRSWKSWSFTSNRSRSMKWSEAAFDNSRSLDAENVAKREDEIGDEKGLPKVKATKRKIRATTPSSEQLKSLKLKEGTNIVAFTFATPMLGKQEPAFRNLICNGLVLASDGKKMSKKLRNYPPPSEVIDDYGADALRLYIINSPVVRAEPLRFKKEGVYSVVKDVFLPWYNAYRFLVQNAKRLEVEGLARFIPIDQKILQNSSNVLDQWINSATQSLVHFVRQEMDAYRLYTVVPYLLKFLDNLTNIYVRFNRKRLKGRTGEDDCRMALSTLYHVLLTSCKAMSPFTPFFTEVLYQNMRKVCENSEESIHYCSFPEVEGKRGERIEESVGRMITIIDLARNIRERHNKPLKAPLREMVVVHPDGEFLDDISGKLKEYVLEELNVMSLTTCNDTLKFATLRAEPDFSVLGKRLGKSMGAVAKAVKALSTEEILAFEKAGEITVATCTLKLNEIKVTRSFKRPDNRTEKDMDAAGDGDVLVVLDLRQDDSLFEAGVAREVVNRIQKLRKKSGLEPTDIVEVFFESLDDDKSVSQNILATQEAQIREALGSPLIPAELIPKNAVVLFEEEFHGVTSLSFVIKLARPSLLFNDDAILSLYAGNAKFAQGLQTYLLSRDYTNLRSEFQVCKGKITVNCIQHLPPVDVVLGNHLYMAFGDYFLERK